MWTGNDFRNRDPPVTLGIVERSSTVTLETVVQGIWPFVTVMRRKSPAIIAKTWNFSIIMISWRSITTNIAHHLPHRLLSMATEDVNYCNSTLYDSTLQRQTTNYLKLTLATRVISVMSKFCIWSFMWYSVNFVSKCVNLCNIVLCFTCCKKMEDIIICFVLSSWYIKIWK